MNQVNYFNVKIVVGGVEKIANIAIDTPVEKKGFYNICTPKTLYMIVDEQIFFLPEKHSEIGQFVV